jgi:hypothetical protein
MNKCYVTSNKKDGIKNIKANNILRKIFKKAKKRIKKENGLYKKRKK